MPRGASARQIKWLWFIYCVSVQVDNNVKKTPTVTDLLEPSLYRAAHVQVWLEMHFQAKQHRIFVIPKAGKCSVGVRSQQKELHVSRRITSQTASLQS